MSNKMPVVSGREMIKVLEKEGFSQVRRHGSHVIMGKGDLEICVPEHRNKALARGTLKGILKQANITKEELVELLKKI